MANERKVTKVKLSNGQIYRFYDKDAIHVDGKLDKIVVGDAIIDNLLAQNATLTIVEINDIPTDEYVEVVVRDGSKRLRVRSKDDFLSDIGGYTAKEENGILSLKLGKQ